MAGGEFVITYKRKRCQTLSSSISGHGLSPSDKSENSAVGAVVVQEASAEKFEHKEANSESYLHLILCREEVKQKHCHASSEVKSSGGLREKKAESHVSRHASCLPDLNHKGDSPEMIKVSVPLITFTRRSKRRSDFDWRNAKRLPHDIVESCLQFPSKSKASTSVLSRGDCSKNCSASMSPDAGISTEDAVKHLVCANGREVKGCIQTMCTHSETSPCTNQEKITIEAENYIGDISPCTNQIPDLNTNVLEERLGVVAVPCANISHDHLYNDIPSAAVLKNLPVATPESQTSRKTVKVEENVESRCGNGGEEGSLDLHVTRYVKSEAFDIDPVDKHIQDPQERPIGASIYGTHIHHTSHNISRAASSFDLIKNDYARMSSVHNPIYGGVNNTMDTASVNCRNCEITSTGTPSSSTYLKLFADTPTNTSSHPFVQCGAMACARMVFSPSLANNVPVGSSNGLLPLHMPFPPAVPHFQARAGSSLPSLPLPLPSFGMNPVYPVTHRVTRPVFNNGSSFIRQKLFLDGIIDRARAMQGCSGGGFYRLPWSEEELDHLWIGVRRHGNNWHAILTDPKLQFTPWRVPNDLYERWREEQNKVLNDCLKPQAGLTSLHPTSGAFRNSIVKDTQLPLGDLYCHKADRITKMPLEQKHTARAATSADNDLPHWLRGAVNSPGMEDSGILHLGVAKPCHIAGACNPQADTVSLGRRDVPQVHIKKPENLGVHSDASSEETISDDRC